MTIRESLKTIVFVASLALANSAIAQPGGHGNPCPKPPCPPTVPISGIEYLLGFGGLYGLRVMIGRLKKKGIS